VVARKIFGAVSEAVMGYEKIAKLVSGFVLHGVQIKNVISFGGEN
jgi:hypothetical protein